MTAAHLIYQIYTLKFNHFQKQLVTAREYTTWLKSMQMLHVDKMTINVSMLFGLEINNASVLDQRIQWVYLFYKAVGLAYSK